MRKFYLSILAVLIVTSVSFAQRKVGNQVPVKKPVRGGVTTLGALGTCDTLNKKFEEWNLTIYGAQDGGYVTGVNAYDDLQKANFFDASATTYNFVTGALFYFGIANSNKAANLDKTVIFRVYDDVSGAPGNEILTTPVEIPLSQIKSDVDNLLLTEVIFPAPVALPASKKFYVSVDLSNFAWAPPTNRDSIALVSSSDGDVEPGQAWEQFSDGSWWAISDSWGLNLALVVLPYLNTDESGACEALPVHLLSFTSQRNNNDVMLNWTVADEIGMKGYEVQKSANNGAFTTVAYVPALNNAKNQAYTVTDKNAFSSAATLQYRLKQIDGDGSVKYSGVLQVKSNAIINNMVFANPFSGALKLNMNLATAERVSVFVYDMQGRLTAGLPQKMYNASQNTLVVQGTENLKPGLYSVKVIAGSEQKVYKVMKQ